MNVNLTKKEKENPKKHGAPNFILYNTATTKFTYAGLIILNK